METVLIADDEKNIREGLKCIIDWESLGFSICGETANGEDTLQAILMKNPSLVLLDIRMPKMYGTDIIRLARENGYKGKFIILSGYSDFSYAQAALRYGAENYLTKPLDEEELLASVLKIKEILEKEHSQSSNIRFFKDKLKNVILHEIVTGAYDTAALPMSSAELEEMNLLADIYQVVIYEKFGMQPQDANYSFAELLKITNEGNHTFEHFNEDNNEVILLKGAFALSKFQRFLDHYEKSVPQPGSPLDSLFLAYGHPVGSLDEIYLSYEEASTLQKRRFFCLQGQHTLGFEQLPNVRQKEDEITDAKLSEYNSLLTDFILSFNRKKVAETLDNLEEYLYNVKNDIASVKLFLTDLYFRVKEKISYTYRNTQLPFPTNGEVVEFIEHSNYLYEIILFLSEQAKKIMDVTGSPSRDTVLDDILYYIDHNYQKSIKLEGIAPLFGYSSAYLGKIFTKSVGESFISYVDRKRVEHSKQLLLQNNLKVYEIAEQVGYKNVDYFHKKFKKYVGQSPAEYRKTLADQKEEP